MSEKIRVIHVSIPVYGTGGYVLDSEDLKDVMSEIECLLEDGFPGDQILLELKEMDKEEYDNLEEFWGW